MGVWPWVHWGWPPAILLMPPGVDLLGVFPSASCNIGCRTIYNEFSTSQATIYSRDVDIKSDLHTRFFSAPAHNVYDSQVKFKFSLSIVHPFYHAPRVIMRVVYC